MSSIHRGPAPMMSMSPITPMTPTAGQQKYMLLTPPPTAAQPTGRLSLASTMTTGNSQLTGRPFFTSTSAVTGNTSSAGNSQFVTASAGTAANSTAAAAAAATKLVVVTVHSSSDAAADTPAHNPTPPPPLP